MFLGNYKNILKCTVIACVGVTFICYIIIMYSFEMGIASNKKMSQQNISKTFDITRDTMNPTYHNNLLNVVPLNVTTSFSIARKFKILYWTTSSSMKANWLRRGGKAFEGCSYRNCEVTKNQSEYNASDAVLFHLWYVDVPSLERIRHYRPPEQKWIMVIWESVIRTRRRYENMTLFDNLFNATWTYKSNSDIIINYTSGYLQYAKVSPSARSSEQKRLKMINYFQGKNKSVAAFISSCYNPSRRLQYVKQLSKHISVDIYGKCGELNCSKANHSSCLAMLSKHYKFFLAFENSICTDYITEKLWNIILRSINVIPIVLGGGPYEKYVPPHSYIDIKDFKSAKHLAEYLKLISDSSELFNSYFWWRSHYKFVKTLPAYPCRLCEYLNKENGTIKTYPDLGSFYRKEDCFEPEEFYTNLDKNHWYP